MTTTLFVNHITTASHSWRATHITALENNLTNTEIDRIVLFSDRATTANYPMQHSRIIWLETDSAANVDGPMAPQSVFDAINGLTTSPSDINIIAEAGIYFDVQIARLKTMSFQSVALALTGWESALDGTVQLNDAPCSHRAWIFQGRIRPYDITEASAAERYDDRILSILLGAEYEIANPALDIRAFHLSDPATLSAAIVGVPEPRYRVSPCHLDELRLDLRKSSNAGVIAFSLFGKSEKYTTGAVENAKLAQCIYPGWILRYYVDASVPEETIGMLRHLRTEVQLMPNSQGLSGMFWRFLIADDPGFDRWMVRDADSRLNYRDRRAVDEWIDSGMPFHIMRDHPNHRSPIMGFGFGGTRGVITGMKRLIEEHGYGARYGDDQAFLAKMIFPQVSSRALIHDTFAETHTANIRPFPTAYESFRFVGERCRPDSSWEYRPRSQLIRQLRKRGLS
jgi:hypothetical protein